MSFDLSILLSAISQSSAPFVYHKGSNLKLEHLLTLPLWANIMTDKT